MLETKLDYERARTCLEQRSPQELADFILSLAHASNGIGAYVAAFALSDAPRAAAEVIASEITVLARGERDYDYRHRQSFEISARADRTIDAIERMLIARDPTTAAELLRRLLGCEPDILDHALEDDDAGRIFDRARELLERIGT